ncbi:MAG: MoaD family protein [Chloroflexi bacterium]|nr:MoaD family protein [Chloroflexota bacterium]
MHVVVRFFASHREAIGRSQVEYDLTPGSTVDDLARHLAEQFPGLASRLGHCRYAVNREYVDPGTTLSDGDEVVLIPPVAGGETREDESVRMGPKRFEIVDRPIDVQAVVDRVADHRAGAIVVFLGVVRDHSQSGRPTRALYYEGYAEMAEAKMAEIADAIRQRWGFTRVAMTHRVGHLEVGEASVVIAIATPHRKQAFEACEYAIDTLKRSVPIWKKEIGPDGEEWVE